VNRLTLLNNAKIAILDSKTSHFYRHEKIFMAISCGRDRSVKSQVQFSVKSCRNMATDRRQTDLGRKRLNRLRTIRDKRSCCRKKGLTCFCNYAKKPYIPRVWHYSADPLTVKGDADQFGAQPESSRFQECEIAIEVSTAHADTVS